jgi:hypothetical protein
LKNIFKISTLLLILALVVVNAIFAFVLVVNRAQIHFTKSQMAHSTYFDLETNSLYKDQNSVEWIDDEEVMIDGNYFDILKITDLGNGKSRVYVYTDDLETGVTKTMKGDELHKNNGKKQHAGFADLLKLKTYTKHFYFDSFLCAQDLIFICESANTKDGHLKLLYHPPTV